MTRIARLIGLFSVLLLLFASALVMSRFLLHKQTDRLRQEAILRKEAQFVAALELAGAGAPPWSAGFAEVLERALDARIQIPPPADPWSPAADRDWQFVHAFGTDPNAPRVTVTLSPPPAARLLETYQRVAAILLNLALGVIVVFAAFLLWSVRTRETVEDAQTQDRANAQAGFKSLHQLASVSARQGVELERERTERLRIEEDLHVKQLLLNRALEQKIRLGQDLHDGIIQSLYATGLTLEAARPLIATDPAGADVRIAGTTTALNTTIREVRAYINGLSPDTLRRQTFSGAVGVLTRDLAAGRPVEFVVSIDEPTASQLAEDVATDLLQVVREAVSNSLRHGGASRVRVSLEPGDGSTRLTIADNGSGFSVDRGTRSGHGLANIEARIRRHGGSVSIVSTPGAGATTTCNLPRPTPSPA